MAEKSTSAFTYSLTLTYGSDTQNKRDGAAAFRYSDVSAFLKRLRRAATYAFEKAQAEAIERNTPLNDTRTPYVRFICAGELGSQKGRVHWHVILFSNTDLLSLGSFKNFQTKKPVTTREQKISVGKKPVRLEWSLWDHGLVTFQEPDQGGISYALKYVLKDQFNEVASRGTMREHKSEKYANGYFRMSKLPPIGALWLGQKLDRLHEARSCPTSLNLSLPEYRGYWFPTGVLREYALLRIYETNQTRISETGKPCPQFSTLLANYTPEQKEWEILSYGEKAQTEEFDKDEFERSINLRAREVLYNQTTRETRRRCGGYLPCSDCLRGTTDEAFDAIKNEVKTQIAAYDGSVEKLEQAYKKLNKPSPWCATPSAYRKF